MPHSPTTPTPRLQEVHVVGIHAGLEYAIMTKLPQRDYYCKELGMNGPHSAGLLSYEKLLPMLGEGIGYKEYG